VKECARGSQQPALSLQLPPPQQPLLQQLQQPVQLPQKQLIASGGAGVPGHHAVKPADPDKAAEPELSKFSLSTVANHVQDQHMSPNRASLDPAIFQKKNLPASVGMGQIKKNIIG